MPKTKHTPVLLVEVLKLLDPKPGDHFLDLTAGYGGHAQAIAGLIGSSGSITLVDRDETSVMHLKKIFAGYKNIEIINDDFLSSSQKLLQKNAKYDVILADLGISSVHVDDASRGFSFMKPGPLDMRMDKNQSLSASNIANEYEEDELVEILKKYGEEKRPKELAKKIVQNRPYLLTTDLAQVISEHRSSKNLKTHPATKAFQALRIAVNDELSQLEKSLPIWVELLNTGGMLGVISFHSLEDRLVKQAIKFYGGNRYDATLQSVTKRPVVAGKEEIVFNPRARSAKLRVAQRK
jgi:16S rRNA (cytosine1402-N4)-methyltransferase